MNSLLTAAIVAFLAVAALWFASHPAQVAPPVVVSPVVVQVPVPKPVAQAPVIPLPKHKPKHIVHKKRHHALDKLPWTTINPG